MLNQSASPGKKIIQIMGLALIVFALTIAMGTAKTLRKGQIKSLTLSSNEMQNSGHYVLYGQPDGNYYFYKKNCKRKLGSFTAADGKTVKIKVIRVKNASSWPEYYVEILSVSSSGPM